MPPPFPPLPPAQLCTELSFRFHEWPSNTSLHTSLWVWEQIRMLVAVASTYICTRMYSTRYSTRVRDIMTHARALFFFFSFFFFFSVGTRLNSVAKPSAPPLHVNRVPNHGQGPSMDCVYVSVFWEWEPALPLDSDVQCPTVTYLLRMPSLLVTYMSDYVQY